MNQVTAVQGLSEEDAALVVSAHLELVVAQASGVRVLGSSAGRELVTAARALLAKRDAFVLVTVPLENGELRVRLPINTPESVSPRASSRNGVAV